MDLIESMTQLSGYAVVASMPVKIVVDTLKAANCLSGPINVVLALLLGPLFVGLLFYGTLGHLTGELAAQAIVAGVIAGGLAVGVTEVHNLARSNRG